MKKIAIYLPSLLGGGAERVMVTLANGFAARGLDVDLVLAKAEGPYLGDVAEKVRVVDLNCSRVLKSLPGLVRYLRATRPDSILSALNHANVVVILARWLTRIPARLVVSERNVLCNPDDLRRSLKQFVLRRLMCWAYQQADAVVPVSEGIAQDLMSVLGVPENRIHTIYNPMVTERLTALAREPLNHSWFETDEVPVFLAVGRLSAQKDFSTLIRAFAKVRSRRDCRLVILGAGELRSQLESLTRELGIKDYVELPGFQQNPFAWMSRASLFVLSSRWEGLPGVLIQAMACGVPVVSTDCHSGPREILENGKWGRLVPVGNVELLAEAIDATIDEPEHPDVASRAAAFGVEQAVDRYLAVLGAGA